MLLQVVDLGRTSPLWILLVIYGLFAFGLAFFASRLLKASLRGIVARAPSELNEVLLASLPRPAGAAIFLVEISAGLRWLPMTGAMEMLTNHLLPFGLGILAVIMVMRVARKSIDAYGRSNPALRSSAGIGHAITWVVGLCLIAVLTSDALGISLAPALTALGVGSLAVALALQDTLSNFFSGIYLIMDKPMRPGDFVRLDAAHEGYVESIGWRATHLRALDNSVIVVPNATLAKGVLTNFGSSNPRLLLEIRVDFPLDADSDFVEKALMLEAKDATKVEGVRAEPAPYVRFIPGEGRRSLGFTVHFELEPSADRALVEHELRKRLRARLRSAKLPQGAALSADAGA
jgi:small-conductance mechanosensitive channel